MSEVWLRSGQEEVLAEYLGCLSESDTLFVYLVVPLL